MLADGRLVVRVADGVGHAGRAVLYTAEGLDALDAGSGRRLVVAELRHGALQAPPLQQLPNAQSTEVGVGQQAQVAGLRKAFRSQAGLEVREPLALEKLGKRLVVGRDALGCAAGEQ